MADRTFTNSLCRVVCTACAAFMFPGPAGAGLYGEAPGLAARDADGWRLGPNGARLSLAIQVATIHGSRAAAMKIVKENWAEVGVFAEVLSEEMSVMAARRLSNAHDVMVWAGDGGLDVILDPRFYLPVGDESLFAVKWARWFTALTDPFAEEPPELVRKQMALYRAVQAEWDVRRQHVLMLQLLELMADFFSVIGICTADDVSLLVKNNLRSVPKVMLSSGRSFPGPRRRIPASSFSIRRRSPRREGPLLLQPRLQDRAGRAEHEHGHGPQGAGPAGRANRWTNFRRSTNAGSNRPASPR